MSENYDLQPRIPLGVLVNRRMESERLRVTWRWSEWWKGLDMRVIEMREEAFGSWTWFGRGRKNKKMRERRIGVVPELFLVLELAGGNSGEWIRRQRRQRTCCCCRSCSGEQIAEEALVEGNDERQLG